MLNRRQALRKMAGGLFGLLAAPGAALAAAKAVPVPAPAAPAMELATFYKRVVTWRDYAQEAPWWGKNVPAMFNREKYTGENKGCIVTWVPCKLRGLRNGDVFSTGPFGSGMCRKAISDPHRNMCIVGEPPQYAIRVEMAEWRDFEPTREFTGLPEPPPPSQEEINKFVARLNA